MIFGIQAIKTEYVTFKKTVCDKNEAPVLLLNIVYPKISGRFRSHFVNVASPFYQRTADAFAAFALGELAEKAKIMAAHDDFKPFAAVMKTQVTYCGSRYFSSVTDASVFDGAGNNRTRGTQVWDMKHAVILTKNDVFSPHAKEYFSRKVACGDEHAEKALSRQILRDGFTLADDGIRVFLPRSSGIAESLFLPKQELESEKLLKISF